ncbi:MAG: L,D-transpeptidase family protein [Chthoniobacterales bacterium]|jgi:lipoprotein-anchoring transpeptidase ErfK/SrfK
MRLLHFTICIGCLTAAVLTPMRVKAEASIVVSVPEQTLAVVDGGAVRERFRISTSKYGLGDKPNSYATPVGSLEIASKIGGNAPVGAVFKSRQMTGEILKPNAAGRDPIVTRILWLRGLERGNSRAYSRNIYIHGTPVENLIGRPVSYGCIRMRSQDVVRLFGEVRVGTKIAVLNTDLTKAVAEANLQEQTRAVRVAAHSPRVRLAAN